MPIYEYACRGCGQPFEKLLPISQADAPQICPKCGGQQTQRRLSTFAVGGSQPSQSARPVSSPFT